MDGGQDSTSHQTPDNSLVRGGYPQDRSEAARIVAYSEVLAIIQEKRTTTGALRTGVVDLYIGPTTRGAPCVHRKRSLRTTTINSRGPDRTKSHDPLRKSNLP